MSELLERIKAAGSVKAAEVLSESKFFGEKEQVSTSLPMLNIAFSAKPNGGFTSGLTVLAGESKTFKTMLGLLSMKAYMDKYPESIVLFYDSEYGSTPEYLKQFNIDLERIIHIPIQHIEELKFDLTKRLNEISEKDRVFIFMDSLGNLASKKEVEDAENEKSVADMSRAKAIKSLFRIITPTLTIKNVPCFVVMHVYKTMDMFPKTVVSGGSGTIYSANQIFIITKSQEKDGTVLAGNKFTINIEKSRYLREKAKLPFIVTYDKGINKYSGLMDMCLDLGYIEKATAISYLIPSLFGEDKFKRKELEKNKEIWEKIFLDQKFLDTV